MGAKEIPIQNSYYLLCYAWDRLDQGAVIDVERIESTELVDLFATVLTKGLDHVARRGLKRGYSLFNDQLRAVRGRIDVFATARRCLLKHGRVACSFDELTTNTLANQIIKSTLRALETHPTMHPENRAAVLAHRRTLKDVAEIHVTAQLFRRVQLSGTDRFYQFLLNVCELLYGSWLPEESKGHSRFRDFARDDKRMALLFQYFVFNFLRLECPALRVFRENVKWRAESDMDPNLSLLPRMQTDISVTVGNKKVIIDTKFYKETLSGFYDSKSLHSAHLYQLISYLSNVRVEGKDVEGILLYPEVNEPIKTSYTILGMPVRIQTLNLARPWREIHNELQALVI